MAKKHSSNNNPENDVKPAYPSLNPNTNNTIVSTDQLSNANIEASQFNNSQIQDLKFVENQIESYQLEFETNFQGLFESLSQELNEIYQKFNTISNKIFEETRTSFKERISRVSASRLRRDEMKGALLKFKEAIDSSFKNLGN